VLRATSAVTKYVLLFLQHYWCLWTVVSHLWARLGLGLTFNPPGGARSGQVQLLEQCFTSCSSRYCCGL